MVRSKEDLERFVKMHGIEAPFILGILEHETTAGGQLHTEPAVVGASAKSLDMLLKCQSAYGELLFVRVDGKWRLLVSG